MTGENSNLVAAGQETALVVENMSKDYRKGIFSSEAISALRPFSLTIPNSTVLCMLGHNGGASALIHSRDYSSFILTLHRTIVRSTNTAGKTTAVHCFIGLQDPTNGSATFFGLDIVYDRSEIHKMMGVCPQFDLLWDDLTVSTLSPVTYDSKMAKSGRSADALRMRVWFVFDRRWSTCSSSTVSRPRNTAIRNKNSTRSSLKCV